MTYSPQTWLEVRYLFQNKTGLPAVSLGIQHYQPDGGGYHEGNDLLAAAGRQDSDYSKRESVRDRPGTNGASAIDIGWFDVVLRNGRRVTLFDLTRWMLAHIWDADALWIREIIYSLDGKTVKRFDRLGIRSSGDLSHLTHDHISGFRDDENVNKVNFFARFWAEMEGASTVSLIQGDDNDRQLLFRMSSTVRMEDTTSAPSGFTLALPNEPNLMVQAIKALNGKADQILAKWAAEEARDAAAKAAFDALAAAVMAGGGNVDTAAILAEMNRLATQESMVVTALQEHIAELEQRLVAAARAEADALAEPTG